MNRTRAQGWLFAGSLAVAFVLQLMPLPQVLLPVKPYWVALVLIYWAIELPEKIGLGFAFLFGMAGDVLTGELLGEQALRLVVLAFIVLRFRARLRFFPMWQQALAVLALLLNDRVVMLMVRGSSPARRSRRRRTGWRRWSACSCGRSCFCCSTTCARACAAASRGEALPPWLAYSVRSRKPRHEAALFRRRALAGFLIIVVCLIALGVRFRYLQIVQHDEFATRSEQNRVLTRPLAPARGLVYDRNGVLLAENVAAFRLEVTPEQAGDMQRMIDALGKVVPVSDDDIARFNTLRRGKRSYQGIPLRLKLSEEEIARFSINRWQFPASRWCHT